MEGHYRMKYDFDLDLAINTSTGKMIEVIKDHSQVLEFGPGNGRMTEYLTQEKNCEVSIVEFDEELYKHVMHFAKEGFLGDIESYDWVGTFQQKQYDYILFADVLEHLRNPEEALKATLPFLKKDGKILISFPNITHNSVLIDLFNNKLDWKEYGLLDKTHLSFYTEEGFKKWFDELGLQIALQDYTYAKVGENELSAQYQDLPVELQYSFKNRLFGEVYQYFFILSKEEVSSEKLDPQNSNFVHELHVVCQTSTGPETNKILINNHTGENKYFEMDIPKNVDFIKIFPVLSKDQTILSFQFNIAGRPYSQFKTNADWKYDHCFAFYQDEQPYFEVAGNAVKGKRISGEIDYLYEGILSPLNRQLFTNIEQKDKDLEKQYQKIKDLEKSYEAKIDLISSRYDSVLKSSVWKKVKKRFNQKLTDKETCEKLISWRVESIEVDDEVNRTFIRGWGFSNKTKEPLYYQLQADEGPYYQVTKQYRPDVNDNFEIDREKKLGFLMEIDSANVSEVFHFMIHTLEEDILYVKVDRNNLSQTPFVKRARYLLGTVKGKGIRGTVRWLKERKENKDLYEEWIKRHEQFNQEQIVQELNAMPQQPLISIVVPVYNVEEKWLEKCVISMQNQFYTNWQLCLADDCSPAEHVRELLEKYEHKDSRIKVVFREENGHISEATNSAIAVADGEYIGFMDNDDELAPNALYEVVKAINEDNTIDFIYTDEDKISTRGKRFDPFFKPSWNSELLRGHNYITHFVVVKRSLLDSVGLLRPEFDGSQDYDFVLRATEQAQRIYHIPKILYHWRTVETSVAFDPQSKEYAYVAGENALKESLKRQEIEAQVEMKKDYGCYKIMYQLKNEPKVSIFVFGESDQTKKTLETILDKTHYTNFEVLTTYAASTFKDERIRIVTSNKLTEMIPQATGRYFVTLRAGLVPKNSMWLDELVNYGHRDKIGAVGGKVINDQDIIFNAGITYDQDEQLLIYDQRGISNNGLGYYFRISLPRELYALTEDCFFIRKSIYEQVGGFSTDLPEELQGVDLCLKIREKTKLKIMWQPYTVMVDLDEKDGTLKQDSTGILLTHWTEKQIIDPYRNPNHLER